MSKYSPAMCVHPSVLMILVAVLVLAGVAEAEESPTTSDSSETVESEAKKMQELLLQIAEENSRAVAPTKPNDFQTLDPETAIAYQRAWQAYYKYLSEGYAFRQRVFDWQDVSTKGIFVVVIVLVLLGMYFAAIQFHIGMFGKKQRGESNNNDPTTQENDIEITVKGIRVRSPVLGVIILVISLAFFYLYLVYVYPISNTF